VLDGMNTSYIGGHSSDNYTSSIIHSTNTTPTVFILGLASLDRRSPSNTSHIITRRAQIPPLTKYRPSLAVSLRLPPATVPELVENPALSPRRDKFRFSFHHSRPESVQTRRHRHPIPATVVVTNTVIISILIATEAAAEGRLA
jgi:hypothetical protein